MMFSHAKAECECCLLHLGTPIGIFDFAGSVWPVRMEVVMAGENSEKLYDNIGNSDFTDRGNIICGFGNNMEVCGR